MKLGDRIVWKQEYWLHDKPAHPVDTVFVITEKETYEPNEEIKGDNCINARSVCGQYLIRGKYCNKFQPWIEVPLEYAPIEYPEAPSASSFEAIKDEPEVLPDTYFDPCIISAYTAVVRASIDEANQKLEQAELKTRQVEAHLNDLRKQVAAQKPVAQEFIDKNALFNEGVEACAEAMLKLGRKVSARQCRETKRG